MSFQESAHLVISETGITGAANQQETARTGAGTLAFGYCVAYSYYSRLSPARKSIYRRSDSISAIALPNAEKLRPLAPALLQALEREDRAEIAQICNHLASGIAFGLNAPLLRVQVLAVRPSASWGELHGLYIPAGGRAPARVTLWMRTARKRRIVAFRTFLRTLLHEICHHLDYELFRLEESFHTEGFYRRESSLFRQLVEAK